MNRHQILGQLNRTVQSIVMCRERLESDIAGLDEPARGQIETNLHGMEKARDYLEDKLHHA